MTDKVIPKKPAELSCLAFNSGYYYRYRLEKHYQIKLLINSISKIYTDFNEKQKDAIKSYLVAESIVNAIWYCEDLALVLKSFQKETHQFLSTIIRIRETEVNDFYKQLKKQDESYFKKLIGLYKIKMKSDEEIKCIQQIPILKRDMIKLAVFYQKFYGFSTAYKHGFMIFHGKKKDTNDNLLFELDRNNEFNIIGFKSDEPIREAEIIVKICFNIFVTIVEALIINLALSPEEQTQLKFSKKLKSVPDVSKERDISLNTEITSFRKHKSKRILPIYQTPIIGTKLRKIIDIKTMVHFLVDQIKKDLINHPHFLVTEDDFKAYLYNLLKIIPSCNRFVNDADGDENYLVHCEYPRGEYIDGEFKSGRKQWDLAILSEKQDNDFWWKKKPVFLGIELKLSIDGTEKQVIRYIDSEEGAVSSEGGSNPYAEYTLLFHLNVGRKNYNERALNNISQHLKNLHNSNPKTLYVYLEAYKDDKREPTVIIEP